jgi:methyl-accepting chemotaxis protein
VTCYSRAASWGGITGLLGAAAGAGSIVGLGSGLGWLVGLLVGASVGGISIYLACAGLIRQATACLESLANEQDDLDVEERTPDLDQRASSLGSATFDAEVVRLRDVLDHLRHVAAEYVGTARLVRQFGETVNGSSGTSAARAGTVDSGAAAAVQPVIDYLEQLRQTAVQIDRDLSALEEANERVASGAQAQLEAVARTATSVEALSDRIDRIAHNAGEAASACEHARQEAQQGLEQVHNVIEGMDRILIRLEANGRKVRRLEDRSTEIGVIVEQIRGISGRTDMLALNATIESIRAGEHGRGFAIVAEEIRKLAERSAAATREIGTLVEAIQADTQESIRALGDEQAETQRESQRIRETGSSLERISLGAERSARLVDGISRSTNDQVATTQDLVRAMQRISDVTQQTQERTAQARSFIKALNSSCEPWHRLAVAHPAAAGDAAPGAQGRYRPALDGSPPRGTGVPNPHSIRTSVAANSSTGGLPFHVPTQVRRLPGGDCVRSQGSR